MIMACESDSESESKIKSASCHVVQNSQIALAPTPPSTPPPPPRQQVSCGACYNCKRPGHWANKCPEKAQKTSKQSSPESCSRDASDLPLVRCSCGPAAVRISRSTKNPERKFFACPNSSPRAPGCGFLKWCDEVKALLCPCGAGLCSYNKASTGPHTDRWYFACRIKKNHGACQFFQWADSPMKTETNRHVDESKGHSSPQSLPASQQVFNNVNNGSCNAEVSSPETDMEFESQLLECSGISDEVPIMMVDSNKEDDHKDLIIHKSKTRVPMLGKVFSRQQTKLLWQFSAVGDTLTEGSIYQMSQLHFHGWLGRLAFSPLQCPKVIIAEDVDMSSVGSLTPLPPLETCGENAQPSSAICLKPSGLKNSSRTVLGKNVCISVLKEYGEALLRMLQHRKPHEHEEMLKLAEATFDFFDRFSLDYGLFSEAVKEYINCLSRVTQIDKSMHSRDVSPEELMDIYSSEKVEFDNVSRLRNEIVGAYEESEVRLQSLSEEVSHAKDRLLWLERELSECEAETLELRTRVAEVSYEKSESERKMEAAYENMKEALDLEKEREMVLDAAMGALEFGRVQLR